MVDFFVVRSRFAIFVLCSFAFSAAPASLRAQPARIEELPALAEPAGSYVEAKRVSRDGRVVIGRFRNGSVFEAVRWNADGDVLRLDMLTGAESAAEDLSDDGSVIAGVCWDPDHHGRAVRWDAVDGSLESLEDVRPPPTVPQHIIGNLCISGDGSAVGGWLFATTGRTWGERVARWNAAGEVFIYPPGDPSAASYPNARESAFVTGISKGDTSFVGYARPDTMVGPAVRAVHWTADGRSVFLPSLTEGAATINASASTISRDGSMIAGHDDTKPARWPSDETIERYFLPPEASSGQILHLSDDGDVAVGYISQTGPSGIRQDYPRRWIGLDTIQTLGATDDPDRMATIRAISADGMTVVGMCTTDRPGGRAGICDSEGRTRQLFDLLANDFGLGLGLTGWTSLDEILACSADGKIVVGNGRIDGQRRAFRAYLTEPNHPPTLEPRSLDGTTVTVRLGESIEYEIVGDDEDGDELAFETAGLPPTATFDPPVAATTATPFATTLSFAPEKSDVGTHEIAIDVRDPADRTASLSFQIVVPENGLPTATAPAAIDVECTGDETLVTFAATVDDPDENHRLTVTWRIGDDVVQTDENVEPGDDVVLEPQHFSHGETVVEIEVTDGYDVATAFATVTVSDTTAPTIVVAEDRTVRTDQGKAFATGVRLAPPQVFDACDGEPALTSDAPEVFELGTTVVVWTAVDAEGNRSTGTQRVTVVDREKPSVVAGKDVTVRVDRGEVFATLDVKGPQVSDNVPNGLIVDDDAPAKYPIGKTRVTWTATDAAGNVASDRLIVTVVNETPAAEAGRDVAIVTDSREGVVVSLDGSRSADVDGHALTYDWTAADVEFSDPTQAKTSATFPVGVTDVRLTVTDEAGDYDVDTVQVTVTYQEPTPQEPSPKRQFVYAKRSAYAATRGLVDEGLWRTQALASIDPANAWMLYASYLAAYAQAFDDYARAAAYFDAEGYAPALDTYKVWRYWQSQYSFVASQYAYYGQVYASYGVVAYYSAYFEAATMYNAYAGYYGVYDFDSP